MNKTGRRKKSRAVKDGRGTDNEEGYVYREVKCPWCDHVFMWNKNGREGLIIHSYRLKETGEFAEEAKCPKCGEKMIVLDGVFEGVDADDDRIETIDRSRNKGKIDLHRRNEIRRGCFSGKE